MQASILPVSNTSRLSNLNGEKINANSLCFQVELIIVFIYLFVEEGMPVPSCTCGGQTNLQESVFSFYCLDSGC